MSETLSSSMATSLCAPRPTCARGTLMSNRFPLFTPSLMISSVATTGRAEDGVAAPPPDAAAGAAAGIESGTADTRSVATPSPARGAFAAAGAAAGGGASRGGAGRHYVRVEAKLFSADPHDVGARQQLRLLHSVAVHVDAVRAVIVDEVASLGGHDLGVPARHLILRDDDIRACLATNRDALH